MNTEPEHLFHSCAAALDVPRKALAAVKADGSKGVHNHLCAKELLESALNGLSAK